MGTLADACRVMQVLPEEHAVSSPSGLRERLHEARTAAGLTQKELARRLKISTAQVSRIESGERNTTPDLVARWLQECGYQLDVVALGTTGRSADLAAALAASDDDGAEAATLLLRLWPLLTAREKRLIMAELAVYQGEYLGR
jgi:transcriptional regulator with XRE-family HTH domain